ncbi:hypothetical protein MKW92_045842 [Papaver armeniacum]|nr:hypothetical protein MKW92_045842 [Papaver armeniacum]
MSRETAAAAGGSATEAQRFILNDMKRKFETEDKKAYLEYVLRNGGKVMDIVKVLLPFSVVSALNHAQKHSLSVILSCSYVSGYISSGIIHIELTCRAGEPKSHM